MNVFVAGATGVLGRELVAELAVRNHRVVGLSRNARGDELVAERGGEPRRGDILDEESLVSAAEGCDVLIHAATAIPTSRKPTDDEWVKNDRVRAEGARNLVSVADEIDADRLLLQSIVWVARQPDGRTFDEEAPPNPDRTTRSALDAERIVRRGGEDGDFDVGILRCGWFYSPESAHTRQMGSGLLDRKFPILGDGPLGRRDAALSILHVEDAARAFAAAVESDATGRWHVTDDEPVSLATMLTAFANRLGAPTPRRIPGWVARPFVGEHSVRLLTNSMPTTNERFRETFDWNPRYSSYRDGLDEVVETWRDDGLLVADGDDYEWRRK
ncbi:NAD-dependent epimerase/dehydratase [Haladaptatus paucihalophilus DX253]|uniref:NAD-dependent epimerase/dehydratase n=1 Tax=Haladaptatus paucihalophilus DX253 TaxID=797209 RepID=E7QU58_HALPU|nr:NAD-dependent epimerase/dehydratase family protein [Haladaptatus paucihalophilus]EFW92137.1 NAD-dependent epimerase/dehydratase [Haladaptatus paucihalophilus DX253]SHK89768.1 Nucleoside-diphosphate-sugar epimerase [Haladaptatus paucihalophilus DX253]